MSTPFPLEEQQQASDDLSPRVNPWNRNPEPGFFTGVGLAEDNAYLGPLYHAAAIPGAAAAAGEYVLSAGLGKMTHPLAELSDWIATNVHGRAGTPDTEANEKATESMKQDALERLKALRPDPSTNGMAIQTLHGLGEMMVEAGAGFAAGGPPGAAAVVGATQSLPHYGELLQQGMDPDTAKLLAGARGALAAAGAVTPMVFGSSLLTRLASGAAANVGFGVVGRSADNLILRQGGYDAMADQEEVFDRTQLLVDLATGAAFGGVAHLGERMQMRELQRKFNDFIANNPSLRDAALVANAALRDRQSAPGVAVDAEAANAHDRALNLALDQMEAGKPVDVSGTGIEDANLLARDGEPRPSLAPLLEKTLRESGILEEQDKLAALEDALGRKLAGEPAARPSPPPDQPTNPIDPNASNAEKLERIHELTDENKPRIDAIVADLKAALPETDSYSNVKSDKSILGKAERPSILRKRPWWGIEHLADTLRFKTVVTSLHDLPAIFDTLKQHGVEIVKVDEPKLAQPNEWGWRMLPTDLRMPNGQLVEHYVVGKHMNEYQDREGHLLFEKWRYKDAATLSEAERIEYAADVAKGREGYGRAWALDFERPGETLTDARASLDKALAVAGSMMLTRSGSVPSIEVGGPHAPAESLRAQKPSAPSTSGSEPSGSENTMSSAGATAALSRSGTAITSANSVTEKAETVRTSSGRTIQVVPKVVEAADILTSDQPGYNQALQPRERAGRAALTAQVRSIAANLVPDFLGSSPEADRGAPITSTEGEVESGNGRVMALRQVFQEFPEKAAAYRQFLESQGYDLTGFKEPILVRERVTPMSLEERQAFTVEANQGTTAAMSAVELGAVDARKLNADVLAQLTDGELNSKGNDAFRRGFLGGLTPAERAGLTMPDGSLNADGIRRLQAAVLTKAYGGTEASGRILGRMIESTDAEQRNILGALLDAAPAFARLRQMVKDGVLGPEFDVTPKVLAAVEQARVLRESGQSLEEHLGQEDLLKPRDVLEDAILRAFYDKNGKRAAARAKVRDTLTDYVNRATAQRLDQASLFAEPPIDPAKLLEAAAKAQPEEQAPKATPDMFGLRTPQGEKAEPTPAQSIADQALADRPNLAIAVDDGSTVPAEAAKIAAEQELARAEGDGPTLFKAAADCFLRNGA